MDEFWEATDTLNKFLGRLSIHSVVPHLLKHTLVSLGGEGVLQDTVALVPTGIIFELP